MPGMFDNIRQNIVSALSPQGEEDQENTVHSNREADNLIALGVLLWVVAQADVKFLPEEETKIREILKTYGKVSEKDMPIVLRAIKEASINRIDLHTFAKEVSEGVSFQLRVGILENLFRIACVDQDLDHEEHEVIRKISSLLKIEHKDFIEAKIRIKKEFGIDTAGL